MIPTVAAAQLALQPYLLWIKLAVYAAIVAAIFGAGWKTGSSLTTARWEHAAAKQAADYQSSLKAAREAERASYAKAQQISRGYQDEIDRLRSQPIVRTPVRLCRDATNSSRVSATGPTTGGPGPAAPAGGVVSSTDGTDPSVRPGPDIGPALRGLARRADEVSAQGRGIQAHDALKIAGRRSVTSTAPPLTTHPVRRASSLTRSLASDARTAILVTEESRLSSGHRRIQHMAADDSSLSYADDTRLPQLWRSRKRLGIR